ncbi:uncharacterized protein LOC114358140 [Ostrinia furnacalis]|uniref:uncharacterized protein LOC114358140 n=1 Tax=Ostrinia furnacalis TaxID=93504 RepID=UPI00103BDB4C|nr:uncharacterized protein LOC114358140 [Ostrinia furnacalis]
MRMQSAKQSGRRRRRRYRADMLCRAVLTAVAISCTFPPAVIGQGSPRKVQIKDLICVLWLSGMQREDLDVNMLRKLQRHNVNIDDMDRESLKRQCLDFQSNKDNGTRKVNTKDDEVKNKTTTVKLDIISLVVK